MARLLVILTLVVLLTLPVVPAHAQGSCVTIYYGAGRDPHLVNVPSWATILRVEVEEWRGTQLRLFVDGVVHDAISGGNVLQTGFNNAGWGGTREIRLGGILISYVGAWTVYACGEPPPTPTPMPSPTPTPTPLVVDGPGCVSLVDEPAEWVSGSLTIYGPPSGWYIIDLYEDPGASGASGVRWRLERSGGYITPPPEERIGNGVIEIRAGESATITILGADGPGVAGLWVAVSAVCRGLEATPIAPTDDDIRGVEFGVVEEGFDCPLEVPRVVFSFSPPFLPSFSFDFGGVRICFRYKRLLLAWGDFNAMDWAIPLLSLGFVWTAWLSLRRG